MARRRRKPQKPKRPWKMKTCVVCGREYKAAARIGKKGGVSYRGPCRWCHACDYARGARGHIDIPGHEVGDEWEVAIVCEVTPGVLVAVDRPVVDRSPVSLDDEPPLNLWPCLAVWICNISMTPAGTWWSGGDREANK